jgi:hypothetical protein
MVQGEYLRVNRQAIRIDVRLRGESSTCCGVNLAFAALRVWCVLRVRCFSFAQLFGIFSAGCDPVCFQGTEFLRL